MGKIYFATENKEIEVKGKKKNKKRKNQSNKNKNKNKTIQKKNQMVKKGECRTTVMSFRIAY